MCVYNSESSCVVFMHPFHAHVIVIFDKRNALYYVRGIFLLCSIIIRVMSAISCSYIRFHVISTSSIGKNERV